MTDTKTIWLTLTDAWALHETLKDTCDPTRLDRGDCFLLRKLQDTILALTFPNGAQTTKGIAAYGAASHPSPDTHEVPVTLEEAWLSSTRLSRQAYEGAQQVLLQVFFVLQQFSGWSPPSEPEPKTELPSWARDIEEV